MSSALAKRIKRGRYHHLNDEEEEEERRRLENELTVVGYSCRLFRDDEKADFINEERHLLQHPVDNSITMDRYDARLHLHDLDSYDSEKRDRSKDSQKETQPGDADETELEFERYRDLMAADDEEEEANCGARISPPKEYASDSSASGSRTSSPFLGETSANAGTNGKRRKEQAFVTPPELELPVGTAVPETMQMHAIIAKTASFVAKKGPQMEIVIKAKQKSAENHFGFLEFDNPLRAYYDHVRNMIRIGKYTYVEPEEESDEDEDEGGDYLHPSLRISGSSASLSSIVRGKNTEQEKKAEDAKVQAQQPAEPPSNVDLQPIMDRLAEYVARNGYAFEDVIRTRKDPLYAFIEPKHEFHGYYLQRVAYYRNLHKLQKTEAVKAQSQKQLVHRSSTASPSGLRSSKIDGDRYSSRKSSPSDRHRRREYRGSSSNSSRHHKRHHRSRSRSSGSASSRSRSRSRSRNREDRERKRRDRKRDEKRSKRRRSKSRSDSNDSDDDKKTREKSKTIKYATFVPVPAAETIMDDGKSKKSATPTECFSNSPKDIVDDGQRKSEDQDQTKKIQEERRAKAKIFLKLIKDKEQNASKMINLGKKPWDDE